MWIQCGSPHWISLNLIWLSLWFLTKLLLFKRIKCGFSADPHTESHWISFDVFVDSSQSSFYSVWIQCGFSADPTLNLTESHLTFSLIPQTTPSIQWGFSVDSVRIPTLNLTESRLIFSLIPHTASSIQWRFSADSMRIRTLNLIESHLPFSLIPHKAPSIQ